MPMLLAPLAAVAGFALGRAGCSGDPARGKTLSAADAEALTAQTLVGLSELLAAPGGAQQADTIAAQLEADGFARRANLVRNAVRLVTGQGVASLRGLT